MGEFANGREAKCLGGMFQIKTSWADKPGGKMKILNVEKVTTPIFYVQTDAEEFPEFCTDGNGHWQRAMGESWEEWYSCDELERAFQEFQAAQQAVVDELLPCNRCGENEAYENGLCWDCLDG